MGSADNGRPVEAPTGGGRTSRGPAIDPGGEQEPGGLVPPYDGRKEATDVEDTPSEREGAYIGGAGNPRTADEQLTSPEPSSTPGGRTETPADEQPAAEMGGGEPTDEGAVGPAHTSGTPRGEDSGA